MNNRLAKLSEQLRKASDARALTNQESWASAWNGIEQELLERLLECETTEDMERYRLAEAIRVARKVRRTMESTGSQVDQLEAQIDQIEGRKIPSVA